MTLQTAVLQIAATVSELLDASISPAAQSSPVQHTQFNEQLRFTPSTTVPIDTLVAYATTIAGGGYTIDLTAAQGTQETVDLTGKKVRAILINNTSNANAVTVDVGGANPYVLNGGDPIVVPAGGDALFYFANGLAAVSGTVKNLAVTGTDGQAPQIMILAG